MLAITLIFAASSIVSTSNAAPLQLVTFSSTALAARAAYITFGGDGSMSVGWPTQDEWMPFEEAWDANKNMIETSCAHNNWGTNNSPAETSAIKSSILSESTSSSIPAPFILAIMMQESKGCVRAPTSHSDAHNPGLMQGAGTASCNPLNQGPISPCPDTTIRAMIHEGTAGQGLRLTLKQALDAFGASTNDDSRFYKAARRYNSGDQVTDPNLGVSATPCYASDIANRLMAPFGQSTCDGGKVAGWKGTEGRGGSQNEVDLGLDLDQHMVEQQPSPKDDDDEGSGKGVSDVDVTGAVEDCTRYYIPADGNTCKDAPIDFAMLRELNARLEENCGNLWAGYRYCIAN